MKKEKLKPLPIRLLTGKADRSYEGQLKALVEDRYEFTYAYWNLSLFIISEKEKPSEERDSRWLDLLESAYSAVRTGNSSALTKVLKKMEAHLGLKGTVPLT